MKGPRTVHLSCLWRMKHVYLLAVILVNHGVITVLLDTIPAWCGGIYQGLCKAGIAVEWSHVLITVCCVKAGLVLVVQGCQRLGLVHSQVNCLSLEDTDICSLYSLPIV